MARWTTKNEGQVIATFKPNPPWWPTLPWLALGLLVLVLGFPVNPGFFPVLLVIVVLIFGGTALASWLWMRSQKTRVAERARAHTLTPPTKHPARDLLVIRRALDPPIGVEGPTGP